MIFKTNREPGNHHPDAKQASRMLAIACGVAASSFAATRLIRRLRSPMRAAKHDTYKWLNDQLQVLERDLELRHEDAKWLQKRISCATRSIFRLLAKAERMDSITRDKLQLAAEKTFLTMKLKVRDRLQIATEFDIELLHRFYRTLWTWVFPEVHGPSIP